MGQFLGQGNTIKHTPGSDVVAGEVVTIEDKICVAKDDISSGVEGELSTNGEFLFAKTAATAYTQGKALYWTGSEATETVGTNKFIGYVTVDAIAADTEVAGYLVNNLLDV
jgi:predicted RecA/RadA family phage recombinase